MTRGGKRAGRGALVILALILASSGALRVGSDVGAALALAPDPLPTPAAEPQSCPDTPAALARALADREGKLRAQELALEQRLAALDLANQAIDSRMAALQSAEETLTKTIALADGAAENDLARLTAVYESMKPKDAAALFAAMEPDFAAGFLGRMQPDLAAQVLSGMPTEKSYAISVLLAGRNALAPKQ